MIGLRDQISYLNRELNQKCSLVGQLQQKVIQSQASIDFFKSQHSQLQVSQIQNRTVVEWSMHCSSFEEYQIQLVRSILLRYVNKEMCF